MKGAVSSLKAVQGPGKRELLEGTKESHIFPYDGTFSTKTNGKIVFIKSLFRILKVAKHIIIYSGPYRRLPPLRTP